MDAIAPAGLFWRSIGPHRGGRVVAVAGHPTDAMTFYFGSTGGGVWKTTNGGGVWTNVSDGSLGTASVGALAVSPSHPEVLYVGMGESCIRGNVSFGDGVYRSDDGGRHWRHLGLAATRHIARVRIHPTNPDVVYVAALGHAFGPNPERGVYRTDDGGQRWEPILQVSANTGAIDLCLDPLNPRILYAAFWQGRRYPWRLESGGEESGLYRSTDGGASWIRLGAGNGLPPGILGRIGVAASAALSGRVYAVVESEQGGLFRSDDWGDHWERGDDGPAVRARPWYYSHVFADPTVAERVYVLAGAFLRSTDAGRHFQPVATPHPDHHDLWIDPRNGRRMIHGADGGAAVSFDAGETWSSLYNQPTGEFYHVAVDDRWPYRVYGSQQDNTTISIPSQTDFLGITERDWFDVGGGESGYVVVHGADPDIVYAGSSSFGEGGRITRFDRRTNIRTDISPWPGLTRGLTAAQYRYRFQWTTPIAPSPHDPHTLYVGANVVFRSRDEGLHWDVISPDLTRADVDKLGPTGGPITLDQSGAEVYCTVFALAESPLRPDLIWVGTDDGLVHRSPDGGGTWLNVTPPSLPAWATVTTVEPGRHHAETAYLAATRHRLDDPRPYLFRTRDGGRTWQAIAAGIPADEYAWVIREDPVVEGLLYCGTERRAYVSGDAGEHWEPLGENLPVVPVHDLLIHRGDVVAATHGRGLWILDDVAPLRQSARDPAPDGPRLYAPGPAVRWVPPNGWYVFGVGTGAAWEGATPRWAPPSAGYRGPAPAASEYRGAIAEFPTGASYVGRGAGMGPDSPELADAGQNPPRGASLRYWLPAPVEPLRLRILDADGGVMHAALVSGAAGGHRYVWDLRGPASRRPRFTPAGGRIAPLVLPGTYVVEMEGPTGRWSVPLEVIQDPRRSGAPDEYRAARARILELGARLSALYVRADAWMDAKAGLEGLLAHHRAGVEPPWRPRYQALRARCDGLMRDLTGEGRGYAPGLDAQLAYLAQLQEGVDGPAPAALLEQIAEMVRAAEAWIEAFDQAWLAGVSDLGHVVGGMAWVAPAPGLDPWRE